MASGGRNQPCRCGSGKKAKRCCGVRRGPSEAELAKAFVANQARAGARVLIRVTDDLEDLLTLYDEVGGLARLDLSCQLRLPRFASLALDRLRGAVADGKGDKIDDALPAALAEVDTPVARAELARAVIALRDGGRIDEAVAAAALVDLGSEAQAMVREGLLASLEVETGVARTPSGLILVS